MTRRLAALWLLCAGTAAAEPQPPDLPQPDDRLDIWGPLKPLPSELRPDVRWDLTGCKQRKVVSQEKGNPPVVQSDASRAYDGAGRLLKIEERQGGKVERTITFTYDGKGRMTTRFEAYAGSGSIGSYTLTQTYAYDAAGRLERATKQESGYPVQTMTFVYDDAGRLLGRTDAGDKGSSTWKLVRSPTGTLLGIATEGSDGSKRVLYEGVADAKGRVARVKTPPDTVEELGYDAAGREVERKTTSGQAVTVARLSYDAAGRLTRLESEQKGPDGSDKRVLEADYDGAGRMVAARSSRALASGANQMGESRETKFSYDDKGRLAGEVEKAGGGGGGHGFNLDAQTSYRYDGKGRLVEVKSHAAGYPPLDRTITGSYAY